jgi:hypothetical protein
VITDGGERRSEVVSEARATRTGVQVGDVVVCNSKRDERLL